MEDSAVVQAQAGDPVGFEELYREHYPTVVRWCRALLREKNGGACSGAAAQDIAQRVFVIVLRKIGQFEGRSSFATWLGAITRNQVKNEWRRLNNRPEDLAGLDPAAGVQVFHDPAVALATSELLQTLDPADRGTVQGVYLYGRSYGEQARAEGVSRRTIKNRLARVRTSQRSRTCSI